MSPPWRNPEPKLVQVINEMMTTNKRPVFLNLVKIKLPVAGIMSIAHRASGALMVLAIPFVVYLLERSSSSSDGFVAIAALFDGGMARLALFLCLWALLHHLLAGVRYLLIDVDIGVDRPFYRYTAWAVLIAAPLLALLLTGVL